LANLALDISNSNKKIIKEIRISSKINSKGHSVFGTGEQNVWGEASFYYAINNFFNDDIDLKISVRNPNLQKLYLDDLKIELFEEK
jgi:hypothetical protein